MGWAHSISRMDILAVLMGLGRSLHPRRLYSASRASPFPKTMVQKMSGGAEVPL